MKAFVSGKKYVLTAVAICFFSLIHAESFRTSKMHIIKLEQESGTEVQKKLGTNECLAIKLPDDKDFLKGIEIKFDIPEAVAGWQDSVACSVYEGVSPSPAENQIDYSASRKFVKTLPGRLSWILCIPLNENADFKQNQYITIMDSTAAFPDNTVLIRMQPVMKGVPEETLDAKIRLTVKPVLSDKGKIKFSFVSEDELQPCTIYVDDKPVTVNKDNTVILDKGVHNVSVVSKSYRNELRTVMVEQAKQTELQIVLKSLEPSILFSAPEGAEVYLDDAKITNFENEITVQEGEHKIRISIGNYEIFRTIPILKGKTYKINCSVDLNVEEY